jgi:hypothetical protein
MDLPSIQDFSGEVLNPERYARLPTGWSLAVADVVGSTKLAAKGRDRDVNFVAGAAVAGLTGALTREGMSAACQFGGDGAIAAIPPEGRASAVAVLKALAYWAAQTFDIDLRVGMVPVEALAAKGLDVWVALQDLGNGNAFGQFLGSGVAAADSWVKADAQWRFDPEEGDIPGLDELSCRWQPIPPGRGTVLCIIADPVSQHQSDTGILARIESEIDAIVPTTLAAPLGDRLNAPLQLPGLPSVSRELRTAIGFGAKVGKMVRIVIGAIWLYLADRLPGRKLGPVDTELYRRSTAQRSDYRKIAGGFRFILDVSPEQADAIEAALARLEAEDLILFGTARSDATVMTCLVGDFMADRHVHFVDGSGLGYWRASVVLKEKLKARPRL